MANVRSWHHVTKIYPLLSLRASSPIWVSENMRESGEDTKASPPPLLSQLLWRVSGVPYPPNGQLACRLPFTSRLLFNLNLRNTICHKCGSKSLSNLKFWILRVHVVKKSLGGDKHLCNL